MTILILERFLELGIDGEVDARERNVTQETSRRSLIQTLRKQLSVVVQNGRYKLNSRTSKAKLFANLISRFLYARSLTLHLKTDFDDLKRIGEDHLRGSGTSASKNLEG